MTFNCLCCTNINNGTIHPKFLPISTNHGEMSPEVNGQYEGNYRNFVVIMRALEMKAEKGCVV